MLFGAGARSDATTGIERNGKTGSERWSGQRAGTSTATAETSLEIEIDRREMNKTGESHGN